MIQLKEAFMLCEKCQTHILRKSLTDYFVNVTVCARCKSLDALDFEHVEVPYHHVLLQVYFQPFFKDAYLTHRMHHESLRGLMIPLTFNGEVGDALMLALHLDSKLLIDDYLRLDVLEKLSHIEAMKTYLIT